MSHDIAIVGAGIGGLCAALALFKCGHNVAVYERAAALQEVGAGLQLSPNAMHVLHALNLADTLKTFAYYPKAAVMRHYRSGEAYFSVPLGQACVDKYGAEYIHIHRADLHQVLQQACVEHGIAIHLNHELVAYHQQINTTNKVSLQFANHSCVEADVLVGADGIKSMVQKQMLGDIPAKFTGQVAWRGTIPAKDLPKGLIKPNANLWIGPNKHLVSYYVRGGEYVNFVAVEERTDWLKETWHEQGDIAELQRAFSNWHPEVTELIGACQVCFLWALFDRKPLDKWVDNQVALLGDACHPMLPFLAQGAAMAIEDAYVLAQSLTKAVDIQTGLVAYQQARLKRTSSIQLSARKQAALYHQSTPIERAKLSVLKGLSKIGLSDVVAQQKLHQIYAYNPTEIKNKV